MKSIVDLCLELGISPTSLLTRLQRIGIRKFSHQESLDTDQVLAVKDSLSKDPIPVPLIVVDRIDVPSREEQIDEYERRKEGNQRIDYGSDLIADDMTPY